MDSNVFCIISNFILCGMFEWALRFYMPNLLQCWNRGGEYLDNRLSDIFPQENLQKLPDFKKLLKLSDWILATFKLWWYIFEILTQFIIPIFDTFLKLNLL